MSAILIGAGGVLTLIAVLLLSGAKDFLPLELWAWMHGVPADSQYFRVISADGSHSPIEFTVLAAGIALAIAGRMLRRRRHGGA
jgi:hypothetical protein